MPSRFALDLARKKVASINGQGCRVPPNSGSISRIEQLVGHLVDLGFTKIQTAPMADGGASAHVTMESGAEAHFSVQNGEQEFVVAFRYASGFRRYATASSVEKAIEAFERLQSMKDDYGA